MYIKSIVLDGFKSYGQRTEINGFDQLFNAITGLNGSGKSNILDSICFILGISNLSSVRAASLQDLIYKSGQAGINKATVSITFDNRDPAHCPVGFENHEEITVTRQVVMGGKNKYLLNGTNVPNKKVQDLFCSVQLNVNNPNFLIMQGKITKVLNMKAQEILAMVEEAAGTRMYEEKRQNAQKHMDKKDAKLLEIKTVIEEDISPKLNKLRDERAQFLEYQLVERELEHMRGLYQVWQYLNAKKSLQKAENALQHGVQKVEAIENNIKENKQKISQLKSEIETLTSDASTELNKELEALQTELKAREKEETKLNSHIRSVQDNVTSEEKKQKQLEKNIANDEKALKNKEEELENLRNMFDTLKGNDKKDSEELDLAQKRYEAVLAGMEVNEAGESETLEEQLMKAKEEASKANTEFKQASMRLTFCQNQLKDKQNAAGGNSGDYEKDKENLTKAEKEIQTLQNNLKKLNFSEEKMNELQQRKRVLIQEIRGLRERIENFESHKPYTSFKYRDPETNFNRASVKGVVCRLFKCKDDKYSMALETAAGGRLYNVVVDTDVTGKKLLNRGNLQQRTTFIPLNKITAYKMNNNVVQQAQNLVGKENCHPALDLITYHPNLSGAMDYIFGNVFICTDLNVAKKVSFHERIKKKCVTLDGDSTDPAGTLSGGAAQKGGSVLMQLKDVLQFEAELKVKEEELTRIENQIRQMAGAHEQFNGISQRLDMANHEMSLIKQRLQSTTFHLQQEEINALVKEMGDLQKQLNTAKEAEQKCSKQAKDIESKMKDAAGYKAKRMKEVETALKKAKQKAEKSKDEWQKKEEQYATLNLEIAELKKEIEGLRNQVATTEGGIRKLKEELEEIGAGSNELKEAVRELTDRVQQAKTAIAAKNKDVQNREKQIQKLKKQNDDFDLDIKKCDNELKELKDACKGSKLREQEYLKKIKGDISNRYMQKAEALSSKEGDDLERKIKVSQEKSRKLGRTVNTEAQKMFESEEKRLNELFKKQRIVDNDKKNLLNIMRDLDEQKKNSLKVAYQQVSKDFGSIFSTLLPGANATLTPPTGKTILQGLEVKVCLGGEWKESLQELSGGQRSLAALSLILAMLLFKPAPLYILDEVDAALDLSHTQNIGSMLKNHFKKSQFIVVSLKDGMFNNANVLFRTKFVDGVSTIQRTINRESR